VEHQTKTNAPHHQTMDWLGLVSCREAGVTC
jgi:hypothetical protein